MTLKGVAKLKGKLTSGLKNDISYLVSFIQAVESFKICTLTLFLISRLNDIFEILLIVD